MSSKKDLPDEVILTADDSGYSLTDEFCESVNEYLADKYGYCNGGWAVEIKVSNIDWDTSEEEAYEQDREWDKLRHGRE